MNCPHPQCQSSRLRNENTYTYSEHLGIPAEFKLINMTRRRKRCMACGQIFFTVEIPEGEYRKLMHKHLTGSMGQVRP